MIFFLKKGTKLFYLIEKIITKRTSIQKIDPCDVIIIQGLLSFYDERIRTKFDLKIFLDGDDDLRLSRRGILIIIFLI